MSSSWERIYWLALYAGPQLICWCVVLFFCLTRRRENPRGAKFLIFAVLVSFSILIINQGLVFLLVWLPDLTGDLYGGIVYVIDHLNTLPVGLNDVGAVAFWSLIALAVFARPNHFGFAGELTIEDDSASSRF